jgi:hypothetical protein
MVFATGDQDEQLEAFASNIDAFLEKDNYEAIIREILENKIHIQALGTRQRVNPLTFPRVTLLLLPMFKSLDEDSKDRTKFEALIADYCTFLVNSQQTLSVKVNS